MEAGSALLMAATDLNFPAACFFCRAHARGVVQGAFPHALPVKQFVIAVGEAVGFVADALHELEGSRAVRQAEGLWLVGEEDFLPLLGEADDGHVTQSDGFQIGQGGGELAFAAVHHHQVRNLDGGFSFSAELLEPLVQGHVCGP